MNTRQRRMPNFTNTEENVLRMLTAKYKNEIEEKGSNATIWGRKSRTWERIAVEFFNNTKVERSAIKLKSKYETMKKSNKLRINNNVRMKQENVCNVLSANNQECIIVDLIELPKSLDDSKAQLQVTKEEPKSPTQTVSDVPKEESPSSSQPIVDDAASTTASTLNTTGPGNDENRHPDMSTELISSQEQLSFYRNKELREREKHLAELTNLEIQRKILEIELKIKERDYNNNNKYIK